MARPRRSGAAPPTSSPAVTVSRKPSDSPEDIKPSIRLTVKMPSSKLREVASGSKQTQPTNPRHSFDVAETMTGKRSTRAKRNIIIDDSDSDPDEFDEDAEGDVEEPEEEEDDEEQDEDVEEEEDDSEDAEGDEDVEMEDYSHVPPPIIEKQPAPESKLSVKPVVREPVKGVEEKEMEMDEDDDDDDELSELESQMEEDEINITAEQDEGEEMDEGVEEDGEDEDGDEDDLDSDDETPALGSRASTPDLSKMTKRQRRRHDQQTMGEDFLQLPMGKLNE